jgi:hypothetical protein
VSEKGPWCRVKQVPAASLWSKATVEAGEPAKAAAGWQMAMRRQMELESQPGWRLETQKQSRPLWQWVARLRSEKAKQ